MRRGEDESFEVFDSEFSFRNIQVSPESRCARADVWAVPVIDSSMRVIAVLQVMSSLMDPDECKKVPVVVPHRGFFESSAMAQQSQTTFGQDFNAETTSLASTVPMVAGEKEKEEVAPPQGTHGPRHVQRSQLGGPTLAVVAEAIALSLSMAKRNQLLFRVRQARKRKAVPPCRCMRSGAELNPMLLPSPRRSPPRALPVLPASRHFTAALDTPEATQCLPVQERIAAAVAAETEQLKRRIAEHDALVKALGALSGTVDETVFFSVVSSHVPSICGGADSAQLFFVHDEYQDQDQAQAQGQDFVMDNDSHGARKNAGISCPAERGESTHQDQCSNGQEELRSSVKRLQWGLGGGGRRKRVDALRSFRDEQDTNHCKTL